MNQSFPENCQNAQTAALFALCRSTVFLEIRQVFLRKKWLAQDKNPSLPDISPVFRYTLGTAGHKPAAGSGIDGADDFAAKQEALSVPPGQTDGWHRVKQRFGIRMYGIGKQLRSLRVLHHPTYLYQFSITKRLCQQWLTKVDFCFALCHNLMVCVRIGEIFAPAIWHDDENAGFELCNLLLRFQIRPREALISWRQKISAQP